MSFVQIVEFHTDDIEPINALQAEWERSAEGKKTATRAMLTQDRKDPSRYLAIVFFDSYESAMANSNLPETQEFAAKMMAMVPTPPTFHDLDVIDERS